MSKTGLYWIPLSQELPVPIKSLPEKYGEALKSKNGPETRHVNMANAASAEKGRLLADYICQ